MAHTYAELKDKTVADLRDIAKDIDHEAVKGFSQLNKEHLLDALCIALKLDKKAHIVLDVALKTTVKSKIKELKKKRDELIVAKDKKNLHLLRRKLHRLKRQIHKVTA